MTSKAFELAQLSFGDNVKAEFGASSDLQIYHNGSDSYVDDTGSGGLILRGNAAVTIGKYTGETMGYFEADGAAYLYHNNAIKFQTSAVGSKTDQLFGISDADTGIALGANGSDIMQFYTGNNERARLDASGNFMVGTTSNQFSLTSGGDAGMVYRANASLDVARDDGTVMFINRLTSDGDLAEYRKNGSTVGSIGTLSSRLHLVNGDTGLRFAGDADAIWPCNGSGGDRSAAIDLGSSGILFKDLYLSGGVYLGGTGSANKLDDYEEGTFTATCDNGVLLYSANNLCSYVKIGNLVTVTGQVRINTDNGGQAFVINNLPFANASLSEEAELSVGAYRISEVNVAGSGVGTNCRVSASKIFFEQNIDNGASQSINAGNNGYYGFTVTYRTA